MRSSEGESPMILNADDFGCVPDGRWVRGVSISAGSAVMAIPSGAVSGTDVGAAVSVPGAADMQPTIVSLPNSKKVTSVAIALDPFPDRLTINLTESDERFVGAHKGWRITIDGAGPNGLPHVTDIKDVGQVSGSTQVLILANPASTEVTNAAAVANDGGRAKLSDHARASVGPCRSRSGIVRWRTR
jgi:hypothetical protein